MKHRPVKGQPVKTWSTPFVKEEQKPVPCVICGSFFFIPAFDAGGFSYLRCKTCGLVQINPQPLPEEVIRRYSSAHGKEYLSYEIINEEPFLKLQKLALDDIGFNEIEKKLLSGPARPRILDAGCATGALLEYLGKRGWDVTGLEISGEEAAYAREKRGLAILETPLEKAEIDAACFDILNASHLIEHLNDPRAFLEAASRVLKPGGLLLLTTPNCGGFQARLFGGKWRSAIFDHLYLFSKRTISKLLAQTGFAVEKIVTWGGLAAGTGPGPLKFFLDRAAKCLGFGDVMIIRAVKR